MAINFFPQNYYHAVGSDLYEQEQVKSVDNPIISTFDVAEKFLGGIVVDKDNNVFLEFGSKRICFGNFDTHDPKELGEKLFSIFAKFKLSELE